MNDRENDRFPAFVAVRANAQVELVGVWASLPSFCDPKDGIRRSLRNRRERSYIDWKENIVGKLSCEQIFRRINLTCGTSLKFDMIAEISFQKVKRTLRV